MAIAVTTDLVDINLSEVSTNYLILGTWATTIAPSVDTYIQGSNTVGGRCSANSAWALSTTPSANLDLSTGEKHVFQWLKCISVPQLDTKANGGLGISLSADATPTLTGTTPSNGPTNSRTWYVGGNEDDLSGWRCFVVDPNSAGDLTLGSYAANSIDRIGIRAKMVGTVGGGSIKPVNIVFDASRYGTGLTYQGINGSTPGTFTDVLATAMSTANAWGILTSDNSIWFGAAKFDFGTTGQTSVSSFKSLGQLFVWRNMPVANTFYAFRMRGASGYATTFQMGDYASGLVSNGNTIKGAGDPSGSTHATWSLDVGAYSTVNLYGSAFSEMYRAVLTSATTMRGCTVKNFGNITAGGATIDDCVFQDLKTGSPISGTYAVEVATTAPTLTNCTFVNCNPALSWNVAANTDGKLDGTTFISGGAGHAIVLGANTPSTITLTNVNFSGYSGTSTDAPIYNNSGKAVTINISGGNTPTVRNGTNASTNVVAGTVTLTLTGLITGSDIVIKTSDTNTALVNVNQNSGGTYAYVYTYSAGVYVDIKIQLAGKVPYQVYDYLLGNTNASLPVAQVADRAYV